MTHPAQAQSNRVNQLMAEKSKTKSQNKPSPISSWFVSAFMTVAEAWLVHYVLSARSFEETKSPGLSHWLDQLKLLQLKATEISTKISLQVVENLLASVI